MVKHCIHPTCWHKLKKGCSWFQLVTVVMSKLSFFQHCFLCLSYQHGKALPKFYIVCSVACIKTKHARVPTFVCQFRVEATTERGPECGKETHLPLVCDFAVAPLKTVD